MKVNLDFNLFDIGESPAEISDAFRTQASIYATYAVKTAQASVAVSTLKDKLKMVESEAYLGFREQLDDEGKKYTEAFLNSLVMLDEEVVSVREQYQQAIEDHATLEAFTWALKQRADMLISLGSMTRQEMQMTGINIDKQVEAMKETLKSKK